MQVHTSDDREAAPTPRFGTRRPVRVRAATRSHPGLVRDRNEDAFLVDLERQLFIVADGLGGHAAGDIASAMAVELVRQRMVAASPYLVACAANPTVEARQTVVALLECAVRHAHRAIHERAHRELDKHRMGTTLDVLLVVGRHAFLAHVGDGRTYLRRNGQLRQLTRDHTMAEMAILAGALSTTEARNSPMRTVLANVLGAGPDIGVEIAELPLLAGDRLLMCTDGLYDYFSTEELNTELASDLPEAALTQLVGQANACGGHDNITGVVVDVVGG